MTSISPLKAAAASGVWPRSFASSASAPCSSSSFTTFGMAVIGGDHQQAVALLVAQVGRQSPDEIFAEFLGLPPPDQLEDLLEECPAFPRRSSVAGSAWGFSSVRLRRQEQTRWSFGSTLASASDRRLSARRRAGPPAASTAARASVRRRGTSPNDGDGGTGLRPHQPVRRSGIVAGGLEQRLNLPHLAARQVAGEVGCGGSGGNGR